MTCEWNKDKKIRGEKLSKETYTPPQILVFGDVITLARGSGSGDSDGCSSGHYRQVTA